MFADGFPRRRPAIILKAFGSSCRLLKRKHAIILIQTTRNSRDNRFSDNAQGASL
jgi:hypothetical protein